MSRLGFVLAFLMIGLAVLLVMPAGGKIGGLKQEQIAELIAFLPLIAMIGAGILASRRNIGQSVRHLFIWLAIILGLASLSMFREDAKHMGARLLAGLMPGHAVTITDSKGRSEVILSRSIGGHFTAEVTVNAQPISMLIDTGASSVTLHLRRCGDRWHHPGKSRLFGAGQDRQRRDDGSPHRPHHGADRPHPARECSGPRHPTGRHGPEPARHELPHHALLPAHEVGRAAAEGLNPQLFRR